MANELTQAAPDDQILILDVSDTTYGANGTRKFIKRKNLLAGLPYVDVWNDNATGTVTISSFTIGVAAEAIMASVASGNISLFTHHGNGIVEYTGEDSFICEYFCAHVGALSSGSAARSIVSTIGKSSTIGGAYSNCGDDLGGVDLGTSTQRPSFNFGLATINSGDFIRPMLINLDSTNGFSFNNQKMRLKFFSWV